MRIAALDYGRKRIGIALSDPTATLASPLTTVEGGKGAALRVALALKDYKGGVQTIVVGLPLLMNGTEGEMAQEVRAFAKEIEAAMQIPVLFLDERLSSAQADKQLKENSFNRKKRSSKIDTAAAALLLQSYLDTLE